MYIGTQKPRGKKDVGVGQDAKVNMKTWQKTVKMRGKRDKALEWVRNLK